MFWLAAYAPAALKRPGAMRNLVETVTVFRDRSRLGGVEIEIAGGFTTSLRAPTYQYGVKGESRKMVAEEGLEPPTRGL